jgi:hypothetical protein
MRTNTHRNPAAEGESAAARENHGELTGDEAFAAGSPADPHTWQKDAEEARRERTLGTAGIAA